MLIFYSKNITFNRKAAVLSGTVNFLKITAFAADTCCGVCGDPIDGDNLGHFIGNICHLFHENCVLPWLEKNGPCPTCRADVQYVYIRGEIVRGIALEKAATDGDLQEVQELLDSGLIPKKYRNNAIELAIENGQLDIVELLLNDDAAISEESRGHAVILASQEGNVEMVRLLLSNNANISDDDRGSAAVAAAREGCEELLKFLLNNHKIPQQYLEGAVFRTAENGNAPLLHFLLDHGTISDQTRGRSVVRGTQEGYPEVVRLLLANGEIAPKYATEALNIAVMNEQQELIDLLF